MSIPIIGTVSAYEFRRAVTIDNLRQDLPGLAPFKDYWIWLVWQAWSGSDETETQSLVDWCYDYEPA